MKKIKLERKEVEIIASQSVLHIKGEVCRIMVEGEYNLIYNNSEKATIHTNNLIILTTG